MQPAPLSRLVENNFRNNESKQNLKLTSNLFVADSALDQFLIIVSLSLCLCELLCGGRHQSSDSVSDLRWMDDTQQSFFNLGLTFFVSVKPEFCHLLLPKHFGYVIRRRHCFGQACGGRAAGCQLVIDNRAALQKTSFTIFQFFPEQSREC